jgi:hypothetical protein
MGDNKKVVLAKFSTLILPIFVKTIGTQEAHAYSSKLGPVDCTIKKLQL